MKTYYAIKKDVKYTGTTEGIFKEQDGILLLESLQNTSCITYQEFSKNSPFPLKLVSLEELHLLDQEYINSLTTPWSEITCEDYIEALNVLPPCRYTISENYRFFYSSEAYTGLLHQCYALYNGKYYTSRRLITQKKEQILKTLENINA